MTDHEALEALSKKAQEPGALLADKGAFLIALETAYRTGQLIPAPSVEEPVAEIERLRGALVSIARETVGVVPEVLNLQMCIHTVNDVARAALGDAS